MVYVSLFCGVLDMWISFFAAASYDDNKVYDKTGPDFGGLGSSGSVAPTKSEMGIDVSDVAWVVGDKAAKVKANLGASVDKFSNSIKGFLDDL